MAEAMDQLAQHMGEMNRLLRTQRASQGIKKFEGVKADFTLWIDSINGGALLINGNDQDKIAIALETSAGLVRTFITSFLQRNANATWAALKQQLSVRFAEVRDQEHALTLLQKIKQKKDESVPLYAERLNQMARDAFPDTAEFDAAPVQRQLVQIFASGLLSDQINFRIVRRKPTSFDAAVTMATEEENFAHIFGLRRGANRKLFMGEHSGFQGFEPQARAEVPMEVDAARRRNGCFRCGGNHRARDCNRRAVNAVAGPRAPAPVQRGPIGGFPPRTPGPQGPAGGFPPRGDLLCWHCGQKGHKRNVCPQLQGN